MDTRARGRRFPTQTSTGYGRRMRIAVLGPLEVTLEDGPVARAWFDHQVPITFHGTFAPSVV